jgi:hypothetical protein
MAKDYSENILFTGAGFTKNFGGLLGKEMWSKIFNDPTVQSYSRIRELLINDYDYESIYHKVLNGKYSEDEKKIISDAILSAYRSLDDICREWIFRNDAPNPVNIYGVNKLIERFSGGANRIGFFFTLNQDLFIERHFNSSNSGLIHPGGIKRIPDAHKIINKLPLKDRDFIKLPTDSELRGNGTKLHSTTIHYVKLHGSYGWLSSSGLDRYVIGKDKEDQIAAEPLLSWYFTLFRKALSDPCRKLLIIGYGFRDAHINRVFADSIRDFGLKLYIISPSDQSKFMETMRSVEYGKILLQGLSGYFPYTLFDMFPADQSDSHSWKELIKCYFG